MPDIGADHVADYPRNYLRFTVREADAILSNFRALKLREILADAKSREPISAIAAASTGSQAAADYGLIPNTPTRSRKFSNNLK
jgi:hypothetical protein